MEVKASSGELTITFNEKGFAVYIVTFEGELRDDKVFVAHIETGQQLFPEKRELSRSEKEYIIAAITENCKNSLLKVEFDKKGRVSMMLKTSHGDMTVTFNKDESNESVIGFDGEWCIDGFGAYGETGRLISPDKRKLSKSELVYFIEAVTEYCKTNTKKVKFIWLSNGI